METVYSYFATAPKFMEYFLVNELISLGASDVKETRAGASFQGTTELAYRVCLWSRIANRVFFPIAKFPAESPEALYDGIRTIPWEEHMGESGTFAVDFNSVKSKITHTKYGALKTKDGIVDYFRDKTGERPSIELNTPDVRVNLFLFDNEAKISIDLSGESLHRRGYRTAGAMAPLKENLAASILIRAGWPGLAKEGKGMMDPMCGSGTFLIEGALIAADSAPGLLRDYYGFNNWKQHQPEIWDRLLDEAEEREREGFNKIPPMVGYDYNADAIKSAISNLERAGLKGMVHFEKRDLSGFIPHEKIKSAQGIVIVNPPYGNRIGEIRELKDLYSSLGRQLREHFEGWRAAVFTGNPDLGKAMGLRATDKRVFLNGTIKCELLNFHVSPEYYVKKEHPVFKGEGALEIRPGIEPLAEPFANRLKKNRKRLKAWLNRESIEAYRIYDQDLPEFAVAVDMYGSKVHVQEYQAPESVKPKEAKKRLQALLNALPVVLDLPVSDIFLKVRKRQKGALQYEKAGSEERYFQVKEYGCRFRVNLSDYLDTGLFPDHRLVRKMIMEMSKGKRFLNLFSYTGTASVYAAKGGAQTSTSVDMSPHYSNWAKMNMTLNGFLLKKHSFVIADCLEWIEKEKGEYDLIFLDPPTFSNSKKMKRVFDVKRDHVGLIKKVMDLMASGGVLVFSTNFRKFKLDHDSLKSYLIEDCSTKTLPPDYQRRANMHKCWKIKK